MTEQSYLLFVSTPSGYELRERAGELPAVGTQLHEDDVALCVTKVGHSPLPGDPRRCAYSQPA